MRSSSNRGQSVSEVYLYDIETYPNCFTCAFIRHSDNATWIYEVSEFNNQSEEFCQMMDFIRSSDGVMVGFNNVGFDYPVIHTLYQMRKFTPATAYDKAMAIINAQWASEDGDNEARWLHQVAPSHRVIPQIDIFRIHHFDNKAKMTSLKHLEFVMRSNNIEDLPFPVGTNLNPEQIEVLKHYNLHDVKETQKFYEKTIPMIEFRKKLSTTLGGDVLNFSDTKIGSEYFTKGLIDKGLTVYDYGRDGRRPRQTKRPIIDLGQAVLPWIEFEQPEFIRIITHLRNSQITETKGVFKGLIAKINGFEFVFGTGGIHGSVNNKVIEADGEYSIVDIDVASYYPNLAIKNRFHPEQYNQVFCDIYQEVYELRKSYDKSAPENAMLKLALNSVYGNSNNGFSVFYDPLYTMKITLNGQLLLCLLAEHLMRIEGLEMIQVNTDGMTVKIPTESIGKMKFIVNWWEYRTGLDMEFAYYKKMAIRDVNNYIAVYDNGEVKSKGAYEIKKAYHKDHSALVVPIVANEVLVNGGNIRELVENHSNIYDFFILAKVPRSSQLICEQDDGTDFPIQNISRIYASKEGQGYLFKLMSPTKKMISEGKNEMRRIGLMRGVKVQVCNDVADATAPIDYDWYIDEVEKLVLAME